ncbi:hypothetical protein A4R28_11880 [Mesorhizobium ciceri]|nr:hypothetical protein A4R28_11880 [Mesorhizobium ciceri]
MNQPSLFDFAEEQVRRREAAAAERRRDAILSEMERKRSTHREWKPLIGELRRATCLALAASCGREWI